MSACKSLDVLLGRFWQHCVYSPDRNLHHFCINHIDEQNRTQKWLLLKNKLVKMNNFVSCTTHYTYTMCLRLVFQTKKKLIGFTRNWRFWLISALYLTFIISKTRRECSNTSISDRFSRMTQIGTQDVNILDLLFGPHAIDHN